MDGDFLQRPDRADELQERAGRLGVFGDVGIQPPGQRTDVGGQPALGRGFAQADGDQVQRAVHWRAFALASCGAKCVRVCRAAHAVAPRASSGSSPNRVSMRVSSISGRPMMAVGSSLWMLSIKAMPKLSALALPAVS
ncbi:hypothetical protein D3C71_1643740 [compost metagenome]